MTPWTQHKAKRPKRPKWIDAERWPSGSYSPPQGKTIGVRLTMGLRSRTPEGCRRARQELADILRKALHL